MGDSAGIPADQNCIFSESKVYNHNGTTDMKLSKRLAYLLRYGAEKEGLSVREGGWINLAELLKMPLLKRHTAYQILQEVMNSRTSRGLERYQKKHEGSSVYIRAVYGRRMERNPFHEGSNVRRLAETCMDYVTQHVDDYDLTDFPDEFVITKMIHKLRKNGNLTNKTLKALLCSCIEHLDLGACYLVESTLKQLPNLCPNLKVLSLRDCGYILQDHLLTLLIKRLKHLECLNLSSCHHVTDRSIVALCKHGHHIQKLNLSHIPAFTQTAIIRLVTDGPPKLCHVDVTCTTDIDEEGREVIALAAQQRSMTVVLEGLDADYNKTNTAHGDLSLALASVGDSW